MPLLPWRSPRETDLGWMILFSGFTQGQEREERRGNQGMSSDQHLGRCCLDMIPLNSLESARSNPTSHSWQRWVEVQSQPWLCLALNPMPWGRHYASPGAGVRFCPSGMLPQKGAQ